MQKKLSNKKLQESFQHLKQVGGDESNDFEHFPENRNKDNFQEISRDNQEQLSYKTNHMMNFKDFSNINKQFFSTFKLNEENALQNSKQQSVDPAESNDPEENSDGFRVTQQNQQNKTLITAVESEKEVSNEINAFQQQRETDIKLQFGILPQNEGINIQDLLDKKKNNFFMEDKESNNLMELVPMKKMSSKKEKALLQQGYTLVEEENAVNEQNNIKNSDINKQKEEMIAHHNPNHDLNILKKSLSGSSSSLHLENYFLQDKDSTKQEQFQKAITNISNLKNFFIKLRIPIFIEFYFYHFLFLVILGPLSNPILYYFFGKAIPRNLGFWGNHPVFYVQTIQYCLSISVIVLYCVFTPKFVLFQSEIIFLCVGTFFRLFSVATKYATLCPMKIQAIKEHVFEKKDLDSENYLSDWTYQKDKIIFEEIFFALRTFEIDPSWFYLEFIVPPEKETSERIKENCKVLSHFYLQKGQPFQPESIHTVSTKSEQFFIYGIIRELICSFQLKLMKDTMCSRNSALTYALIRCCFPTFHKIWKFGWNQMIEAKGYEWHISIAIAFMNFCFYYWNIWSFLQGVIDIRRKMFMMQQMAFIISPRKLKNIDIDKILPTINIFRSSNLKAWQLMRSVCHEYGKRYDIRIQAIFTAFSLATLIAIIILLLEYINVIELENSFKNILLFESLFAFLLLCRILYYGAKVNKMFDVHDSILNQNKGVLVDIYRMRRKYLCPTFKTTNYLYSKAIIKIKEEVEQLNIQDPSAHIKEIVDSYDTHIEELKFDKEQHPFKIGSITITSQMLESGMLGIGSLLAAVIGNFFQGPVKDY